MSLPAFSLPGLALKPIPRCLGWFRGPVLDWQEAKALAAQLRAEPAAASYCVLVGWRGNDKGHRLYVTPPLQPREIVKEFGVGGREGADIVARTADRLEGIASICPFVVTFADEAGLHADFARRLDSEAAVRIEALWSSDEGMIFEGLEGYLSGWSGNGPVMVPCLLKEQALQLWWD